MGIEVYLVWDCMTEEDRKAQDWRFDLAARGDWGFIHESYGVSPHPSAILVREAFESEAQEAAIPAAVMRERLHSVTEPAMNVGVNFNTLFALIASSAPETTVSPVCDYVPTRPCSVWECVLQRVENWRSAGGQVEPAEMMAGYTKFVELAERKEREQGHPCRVIVDQ
jgi:hypothetical protein